MRHFTQVILLAEAPRNRPSPSIICNLSIETKWKNMLIKKSFEFRRFLWGMNQSRINPETSKFPVVGLNFCRAWGEMIPLLGDKTLRIGSLGQGHFWVGGVLNLVDFSIILGEGRVKLDLQNTINNSKYQFWLHLYCQIFRQYSCFWMS